MSIAERSLRGPVTLATVVRAWLKPMLMSTRTMARRIRASRFGRLPWRRVALHVLVGTAIIAATLIAGGNLLHLF